jgi:hypothetical protein
MRWPNYVEIGIVVFLCLLIISITINSLVCMGLVKALIEFVIGLFQ